MSFNALIFNDLCFSSPTYSNFCQEIEKTISEIQLNGIHTNSDSIDYEDKKPELSSSVTHTQEKVKLMSEKLGSSISEFTQEDINLRASTMKATMQKESHIFVIKKNDHFFVYKRRSSEF